MHETAFLYHHNLHLKKYNKTEIVKKIIKFSSHHEKIRETDKNNSDIKYIVVNCFNSENIF
jgi:hypothetical protein